MTRRDQSPAAPSAPPQPGQVAAASAPAALHSNPVLPSQLLDAARDLLKDGDLSMDALATQLGISRSRLYRTVGSKQALLAAVQEAEGSAPPADTRSRILDALQQAILTEGWEGASMDRVAGLAGVSVATLYRHFRDRDSLVIAFVRRFRSAELGDTLEPLQGAPFEERLYHMVHKMYQQLSRNRQIFLIMLSARARHPELEQLIAHSGPRTRDWFYSVLRQGMDEGRLQQQEPERLAPLLLGLIMASAVIQPQLFGDQVQEDSATAAQRIVSLFLRGAAADWSSQRQGSEYSGAIHPGQARSSDPGVDAQLVT